MGPSFIEALAVERFHGVGPATAAKMKKLGIFNARDLWSNDEAFLLRYFGKAARRGIDRRPVLPNRIRKSISRKIAALREFRSVDNGAVALPLPPARLARRRRATAVAAIASRARGLHR
jgi:DNA polymerase-4